ISQRWPQVLPGGTHVLYSETTLTMAWDDAALVVQPLGGGAPKVVVRGGYYGRYVPSPPDEPRQPGQLGDGQSGRMMAVPFDLRQMTVTGSAVRVLDGLSSTPNTGGAQFAMSADGTLVFLPGSRNVSQPLQWLTRDGKTSPLRSTPSNWSDPRFSPD